MRRRRVTALYRVENSEARRCFVTTASGFFNDECRACLLPFLGALLSENGSDSPSRQNRSGFLPTEFTKVDFWIERLYVDRAGHAERPDAF